MWHLASPKRTQLGCLCRGDTRCHSLIEWWLSWMEPPVFTFYEDMLMQIDANDADLSMQISHATTLLAFVLQGQTDSCESMFVDAHVYWFMFGSVSGVYEKSAIHEAMNAINTSSPINSRDLAGFSAWLTSSGREKHSYGVFTCSSLKPQISDLYLLRNPNIVWLFLSLSALFDSWQKRVHRKGKWMAEKSVLHCEFQNGKEEVV